MRSPSDPRTATHRSSRAGSPPRRVIDWSGFGTQELQVPLLARGQSKVSRVAADAAGAATVASPPAAASVTAAVMANLFLMGGAPSHDSWNWAGHRSPFASGPLQPMVFARS